MVADSIDQEPNNNVGAVEPADDSMEQESENPNWEESLPVIVPQVQHVNVFVDVDLINDKICQALKDQMV